MVPNRVYRRAAKKIENAWRSGAKELDLSLPWNARDSERLTDLPESLGQLTQLQSLNLSNNRLTALPECLDQLTQLQSLNLTGNQLTALPEWLGHLTRLQELSLGNNKLAEAPPVLQAFKNLRILRLYRNDLRNVPDWIGQLRSLELLDLGANGLKSLPEAIGDLSNLKTLWLHEGNQGNPLGRLPDWLGKLEELQVLGARYCGLNDLPSTVAQLRHLARLNLQNNPLNQEFDAAYKEGLDAVKRYLLAKAEAQVVLNEAKLILVGEGQVGKSCLLGALRGDRWEEGRPTTHGIEIKSVKVTDPATGREIMLNGWDFGGQRVYRPTHQLFFSSPAVYLVVWKPREGPQQGFVKEWIKLVKHREPDAKILVVATHGGPKERQPDINRQEIWDLFGKDTVIDFFHVDNKPQDEKGTCKEINDLKDAIAKVAASLPEVGRSVPKRWQDVREALKETGEAYLPLDRVLDICADHKMSEEEAQDFVRISHRLGHLIHYGHDPRLKEMVILKPDWLASAVSFVLDDEDTRKQHGLVKFTRLGQLWNDKEQDPEFRYPPKVHPMFVALMERFDLSYQVAGAPLGGQSDQTSLIAQLVPDVRPERDIAREWPEQLLAGDEQQVQTCLIVDQKGQSATAEGLFYQLIVRLHKFSLGRQDFNASVHWQRGLILDDDYNGRALLEHDGNDVRLTVRAAYPGNFLAVLTREVKWLVENFWEGLKCQVVVPCVEPCGKNLPGTGLFEVEKLIKSKRPDRREYPCSVCNEWQNIDSLLRNAPAARRPPIESLLTENFGDMRSRLDELRQQNLVLGQDLRRSMSQVEDAFRGVMQTMTDEGKDGPRLFSLEPVERSAFNPDGWVKKKFRVTLWCEHTRLPLPLLNKHDKEGVYEFDVTREWFAAAAPFLKVLVGTLSLVLPVAASATKLALDETTYKGLEKQLDLGKACADAMLKASDKTVDRLIEKEGPDAERTSAIRAHGGVLREFQAWLKQADPGFGDLRKVLNKQKEFLWVHRDFEKEY